MQHKFFILSAFLLLSSITIAIPTLIHGKSSAGDAFVFRLYAENDGLSGIKKLLDQQRPDTDGKFMLGFEAKEIQKVSIEVGLQSMSFYVIPGETYELNFNEISLENQNVFLPQNPLDVIFEKESMLNMVIDGFEYEYQKFLGEKFLRVMKYRDKKLFDQFSSEIAQKLEESPLDDSLSYQYVKSYIDYRLAELSLSANLVSKKQLGMRLLTNQPILYDNPAYISFFKKYFNKYFFESSKGNDYYQIRRMVNQGPPIASLMDELGRDPVLLHEKLRELVLLYSLKQVFYNDDFSRGSINSILQFRSKNSKFAANREISKNIKIVLNRFVAGQTVPDFTLSNLNGEKKSLSSYQGKKVYLMFVTPNCQTCEADIRVLKAAQSTIKNQITLLTVFTGFNQDEAVEWVKKQKADWDFLWFNDDFDLLNEYQVKTFPRYLIIDKDSNLFQYFPPSPRENLITYLSIIEKQEKAKAEGNTDGAVDIFKKN